MSSPAARRAIRKARTSTSASRRQPGAGPHRGLRPAISVALLKIDWGSPPAAARLQQRCRGRRAGRRDRQPLRRGAVALDRRGVRAGPRHPVADRLRDHRRRADRRGDQPRQLRRSAARRARARARHQRADPDDQRRGLRCGLRHPGDFREALDQPACAPAAARTPTSAWRRPPCRNSPTAWITPGGARRAGPGGHRGRPLRRGGTAPARTPCASRSASSRPAATSSRTSPVRGCLENSLAVALLAFSPGQRVRLDILRDGDRERIDVELGERPLEAPRR